MSGGKTPNSCRRLPRRWQVNLIAVCLMLAAFGMAASDASASHLRSENLNWTKSSVGSSETIVTFKSTEAIARSAFSGSGSGPAGEVVVGDVVNNSHGCITYGDGSQDCPQYKVTAVNAEEDWVTLKALAPSSTTDFNVPHSYANSGGPYVAYIEGCCTIGGLSNNTSGEVRAATRVDLSDVGSPISTLAPVVTLRSQSGVQTFRVPTTYSGTNTMSFRLSTDAEACGSFDDGSGTQVPNCTDSRPPSLAINSSTGVASFDTSANPGLWYAGFVIQTRGPAPRAGGPGPIISTSQVQFILRVGGPPDWSGLTPADGATFNARAGEPVFFDLEAVDPDSTDTVQITQTGGPGTLTPTDGNPASAHYSFTPTVDDAGREFTVQVAASEVNSLPLSAPPRTYTIRVEPNPTPEPPPPTPPTPPIAPQAPPENLPLPEPVRGATANAVPETGQVFVKLPAGTSPAKAKALGLRGAANRFIPLGEARQVPMGSTFDTMRGTVGLTTAAGAGKTDNTGSFNGGRFVLQQSTKNPLTTLSMTGGGLSACKLPVPRGGARNKIVTEASRRRRIFSSVHGRFRTRGRQSSATVRGTQWTMTDTCGGTLTAVKEGTVVVRDFGLRKNKIVKAGHRYFAKARSKKSRHPRK